MADTLTAHYSLIKPEPTAANSTWGISQNAAFDIIDATMWTFLPKAGGTLTGDIVRDGAAGSSRAFWGDTTGSVRWKMSLGDAVAEGGSAAGSNFKLENYDDTGAAIGNSLQVERSSGILSLNGSGAALAASVTPDPKAAIIILNKGTPVASSVVSQVIGSKGGVLRWSMVLGNGATESGANAGSNFSLSGYNDAGTIINTPLSIVRSNGRITTATRISVGEGYVTRTGLSGSFGANVFNINWTGASPQLWIDNSNLGTFVFSSDYRTKKNIKALSSTWDRVKTLNPVSYLKKDWTPPWETSPISVADGVEQWGLIAHELQDTLVMSAATGRKDEANLIQSPNPWTVIAALTKALQEAMTRIETLEAKP